MHDSSSADRAIVHVDMDAFYAAIEVLDHPAWRGLPLVVGGLGRRGVVSTCSYEARKFGVRSAMPTAEARRRCPDAVYVSPRMSRYTEVSAEVFAVFREITPEVEGLSLDEAFLDVGASRALFGDIETIGRRIKDGVRARTGLAASVGMAHNKLLAKLASELSKPDGFLHLTRDAVQATLDPLPVGRLWTVGKVADERLAAIGIRTIGALRTAEPTRLARALGRDAAGLQLLAAGIDERPVNAEREEKSLSAENTFAYDLTDWSDAASWLMRLAERVGERLRHHGFVARTIGVKLRAPPFETHTRQATLATPSDATAVIHATARPLLERWWNEQRPPRLRLLGVSAQGLIEATAIETAPQADLFASPAVSERKSRTDAVADRITQKFGAAGLRRARGLDTSTKE